MLRCIREINFYALDGELIISVVCINDNVEFEIRQAFINEIQKYKNVSRENPHQVHFIPMDKSNENKLDYFDNKLWSSCSNFNVIYTKIDRETYSDLFFHYY